MIIKENIYKQNEIKIGDLIVTRDYYIFMIVKDDEDDKYKLLRIKDGGAKRKTDFLFTICDQSYDTINELVKSVYDRKTIVPNSQLILYRK